MFNIIRPKSSFKLPIILSKTEIKKLLGCIKNLKHKALFTTIYSAGLRLNEARNLTIDDIDSNRMLIRIIQSKGNVDRYTLLGKKTLEILRKYRLKYRPPYYLFPGQDGNNPMANRSIQHAFYHVYKLSGLTKRSTVHTLRHSFATHLWKSWNWKNSFVMRYSE